MNLRFPALAFVAVTLTAPALASTDGTYGPTSTGTFNVTAAIAPAGTDNVQVSGLDDFTFMGTEGMGIMGQTQQFCLIRQDGGPVNVTISDSTPGDMVYRVAQVMGMNYVGLTLAVTVNGGMQAVMSDQGTQTFTAPALCDMMSFSSLQIDVPNGDMAAVGNYSGTFTVLVAPQ